MGKRINWRLTAIEYVKHVIKTLRQLRKFAPVYTYTNLNLPVEVYRLKNAITELPGAINEIKFAQERADLAQVLAGERHALAELNRHQNDFFANSALPLHNEEGTTEE